MKDYNSPGVLEKSNSNVWNNYSIRLMKNVTPSCRYKPQRKQIERTKGLKNFSRPALIVPLDETILHQPNHPLTSPITITNCKSETYGTFQKELVRASEKTFF